MDATAIPAPVGWEDPLTGLEGPDFWQRILVSEVARAARYKRPITVVLVELGNLTALTETWGDEVALQAVREAGRCLQRVSRTSDYCCRLDATKFGVVLTETDEIAAINSVERVREAGPRSMPKGFEALEFSFGWASPKSGESADTVVRRAETRLAAELAEA
jgi:diguanylate cyclase (GGDEF)-like protein